ncbi:ABC transporter substrate-binding protein [Actinomarinicola tropica]|uniref:ABC transporter substrate-binding protein n=2 Tax=Actinomarinicola tropica TaxID=2789776 RepID=A0A5Q2RSH0_9ACTN|nr:ABC transporter substrate-binding protein [Actinomarinicola tropica]
MAIVLMLVAAACGDDGDDGTVTESGQRPEETTAPADDDGGGTFPVTVSADNGEVTIESRPEAIVSISPTGTEMLFAIGAGDQVVAVDEYSYYPEEAPVTDLSGFQPNVEAIASYEPDLVVLSTDPGDVADGLERIGIPAIHLDSAEDLDDTYRQLELLGVATGNVGSAAEVVSQMQTEIDEIVATIPDDLAERTYFHELDSQLYSVSSDTFIGRVYALLGLRSIGDEAPDDAGNYPQLSEEFVLDADPDFIFLADAQCCDQSPETVAARPGWDTLTAVEEGRVIVVDEDAASRWGPRIVDFLREVADEVLATADAG